MLDLDRQLREFGSFVDEAVEPLRVAEVTDRTGKAAVRLWRHNLALVGVAAALVVLVIAVVVILDPFGSEAPFIEEPTTVSTTNPVSTTTVTEATVAPSTTATTAPALEHPTISWVRIESGAFGGEGRSYISDIVEGGPGLVAVGEVHFDDEPGRAAIWHSTDGTTWSRVQHDETLFGDALIHAVAAGGPGLVAVGNAGGQDEDSAAAVWVSEDGVTWSRIPHDEEVFGGPAIQDMWDVAVGGPGLVAVGWDNTLDNDAGAAVWTSSDGLAWDRVPRDETIFGGRLMQGMWGLASGDGGLVAVGLDGAWWGAAGPDNPAGVWTSPDGLVWSRVPDQEQLRSGQSTADLPAGGDWALMNDVIAHGDGYVALGRAGWCRGGCDEIGAAWTSADGITWQRGQTERVVSVEFVDMQSVAALGDVLVGVGSGGSGDRQNGPAIVWTSVDGGQTWARQAHSGTTFGRTSEGPVVMYSVTEFGAGLAAAGHWEWEAAVWIGTIEQ